MDGKHVMMQAPAHSESMYFNYKQQYSLVLLAVVDDQYNFVMVDVGAQGKHSDGSVFVKLKFGTRLKGGNLDLPAPAPLPGTNQAVSYAFVADEAFPLHKNIMRPFSGAGGPLSQPQSIFNYTLSRARRIVENAFGIVASRFRVFRRPLLVQPETADVIVLACTTF